jgi:hypothetical protein
MGFIAAVSHQIINKLLRNTDFTHPTTIYVSLHTADPGESAADEVAGGSYARQSAAFDAPSGEATSNSADIEFTSMPACTVTHVSLMDASSGGNVIWAGALSASKTVNAGDTFKLPAGDLDIQLT